MKVNAILLVSSLCHVCNAVSRSISWVLCLPVIRIRVAPFFEKLAHFLALAVKVGVVTKELP